MSYATDGKIGVDLTYVATSATEVPRFTLGETVRGNNGSEWMYVLAGSALTQYAVVAIDETYTAKRVNATFGTAGHTPGFVQTAFSAGDYGWVATKSAGDLLLFAASGCAADVPLYTDVSAAGVLDDSATATQVLVAGVKIVSTMSSTTGTDVGAEFIAVNPHFGT